MDGDGEHIGRILIDDYNKVDSRREGLVYHCSMEKKVGEETRLARWWSILRQPSHSHYPTYSVLVFSLSRLLSINLDEGASKIW